MQEISPMFINNEKHRRHKENMKKCECICERHVLTQRKIASNMGAKNIEKLYFAKSLKTPYITWQVFLQKSKPFLIDINEFYCNISLGV